MKTITMTLSTETVDRATVLAANIGIAATELISFLLEGRLNPRADRSVCRKVD